MRQAVLALDPTRPITANMNKPATAGLTSSLDVQGVSHSSVPGTPSKLYRDARYSFPWFHQTHPTMPLVSSEGTTCVTQRGVNTVNFSRQDWEPSFNGDCISKRLCPAGKWVNQKDQDGGCAQSWTLVYDEGGVATGGEVIFILPCQLALFAFVSWRIANEIYRACESDVTAHG
jgi:hypothetical protein